MSLYHSKDYNEVDTECSIQMDLVFQIMGMEHGTQRRKHKGTLYHFVTSIDFRENNQNFDTFLLTVGCYQHARRFY